MKMNDAIKVNQAILFVTGFWRNWIFDKINETPKNNIILYKVDSQNDVPIFPR